MSARLPDPRERNPTARSALRTLRSSTNHSPAPVWSRGSRLHHLCPRSEGCSGGLPYGRTRGSRGQQQKAEAFRALHEGEPFMMPNPWDAGSAKVLAALGFKALATTSAGFAFTLGRLDGDVTLDEVVDHTRVLDRATSLPVSVDLENGYGAGPEDAARAVTRAAQAGAVGGSIEDYDPAGRLYGIEHAAERVAAAAEAAARLGFPFMLTARAENHIRGNPDLDDTIARLQAYERAGADVLYAPGLRAATRSARCARRRRKPRQRARAAGHDDRRDRRGGRAAHQRRRRAHLGRGRRDGRGREGDARRRRPLVARCAGAAAGVAPGATCVGWLVCPTRQEAQREAAAPPGAAGAGPSARSSSGAPPPTSAWPSRARGPCPSTRGRVIEAAAGASAQAAPASTSRSSLRSPGASRPISRAAARGRRAAGPARRCGARRPRLEPRGAHLRPACRPRR